MSPTEAEDGYIALAEAMGASIGGGDDTGAAAAGAAGAGYKTLNVQTRYAIDAYDVGWQQGLTLPVRQQSSAGVTTILLNRPEKYNAFNFDM